MTKRTYWHLEKLGRKPTDYDIASSRLLYYTDRGLETKPPLAAWFDTHQRGSPLQCDWETFGDPRATTYASYTQHQRTREAFVDGILRASDVRALPAAWLAELARILPVLRYPVHGLQMLASYIGHLAPSSKIVIACAFQAADELRRVQRFAYRMRQLQDLDASFGSDARRDWETGAAWQPLRELVERMLVTYDWGEAFVALQLALKPRFDAVFGAQLGQRARAAGDDTLAHVLFSLGEDSAWHAAWTAALVDVAVADRPANRGVIDGWLATWTPKVERALAAWAS